jgi:hypothetical protein
MAAPLPETAPRPLPAFRGLAWWLVAMAMAVLVARLTMMSIQLGCTVTLVVLTVGLYVRNRTAALALVWIVWLVAPFLRRIFLLSEPIQKAEPLALAPFVVTAAVVALELTQVDLSRRVRRLLTLVAAGYALGLPVGLLFGPQAAVFAYFAYVTAVGCLVIGYREAQERNFVLPKVLMVAAPALVVYAFLQYFTPLPEWDLIWQRSADINTVGSPETGRIRVWSTLNSPGTFGLVLGVTALMLLTWGRLSVVRVAALLGVLSGLALTYVRSAWVGIVFAVLAVMLVTRGAAVKRIGPVVVVAAVLAPVVAGGSTGAALSERFGTLGSLSSDESAQARTNTPARIVPRAIKQPIGTGLGSAGEATRLNAGGGFKNTDNAFLSLLAQVGPIGFLVVLSVLAVVLSSAWRNAWRRVDFIDVLVFAVR